jgi:ubiquinone/menaquinone biosynthesis C-methylase UbiE
MNDLEWTGERLVTSVTALHGVIEHLHRYALALEITKNKTVLDIASGEGYGSFLLSGSASFVYGVDIDNDAVLHAQKKYQSRVNNLDFKKGSASIIPLPDNSIDVVVSFETLEHHDLHDEMMQEIKRVLKQDGKLLISSPEKSIYKERDAVNPYHIKELTLKELKELLGKYFKHSSYFQQRFTAGSLVTPLNFQKEPMMFKTFDGNYEKISEQMQEDVFYNKPFFNIAVCSDAENKEQLPVSFFNGVIAVKNELQVAENKLKNIQSSKAAVVASKKYKLAVLLSNPRYFFSLLKRPFTKKNKKGNL